MDEDAEPVALHIIQPIESSMFRSSFILCVCGAVALSSCSKREASAPASPPPEASPALPGLPPPEKPIDVCALLTSEEIEAAIGEPLKETTPHREEVEGFLISQCHFALPTVENSFIVRMVQRGNGPDARDPRAVWQETFARDLERAMAAGRPPEKVPELGDEAYWLGGAKKGALNVLSGHRHFRVGVGGEASQALKIEKGTKLARAILGRL